MLLQSQVEEILGLMYDQKHAIPSEKAFLWDQLERKLKEAIKGNPSLSIEQAYAVLRRDYYPDYAKRRRLRDQSNRA